MFDYQLKYLLSDSVGDALIYVKSIDTNFEGCEATSEFCKIINNALDMLNSRKLYSLKPFNRAISYDTIEKYEEFTFKFCAYIEDLKLENGVKVLESQRKTGFKGLMMGLHNALTLFKLLYSTNHITFLLTYKLSQDHIETLFSAVRSKGGYNDNPTCRQFQAAYKRLLVHNAIVGSTNGNCNTRQNSYNTN